MRTKPAKSANPSRIDVRVAPDVGAAVRELANRRGLSLSEVVERACKNLIKMSRGNR